MKIAKQYILFAFLVLMFSSCLKSTDDDGTGEFAPPINGPTLTTTDITSITSVSAVAGGDISANGGSSIIATGVCWNTSPNPTITNFSATSGSVANSFSTSITGLTLGSTYYVRAWATNGSGTSYGNQVVFTTALALGQIYQGGILFYLDARSQHGLIAAPQDQDTATWGCTGDSITGAAGLLIFNGKQNTANIDSQCTATTIAAYLCHALTIGTYNDWYLPSYDESHLLFLQRRAVGNLTESFYWSSTQYNSNYAYYMNCATGFEGPITKDTKAHVRAIRAF